MQQHDLGDVPAIVDGGSPAPIPARIPVPQPVPGALDFDVTTFEYNLWSALFADRLAEREWSVRVHPLEPDQEPFLWSDGTDEAGAELTAGRLNELAAAGGHIGVTKVGRAEKVARWVATLPGGTSIIGPWETVPMTEPETPDEENDVPEERPSVLDYETRMALYVHKAKEMIKEHGWMLQGVFPTAAVDGPEFTYTVGLTEQGRPELMIVGLPSETAGTLLNAAAEIHRENAFEVGGIATGFASIDFRVVDAPHAEIGMANRVYGKAVKPTCLQLLWPDKDGHYPGDPGWKSGSIAQPIYDTEGGRNA